MKTNYQSGLVLSPVLLILACVPTASALYNPSAGSWLNRDPISEQGGPNLYGFVGNNPIERLDPSGLDFGGNGLFFWFFRGCICRNALFNKRTHCCCNGQVVSKTPIATGIVRNKWTSATPGPNGTPFHVWLTWPGGSIDNNAVIGNHTVSSPAAALVIPGFSVPPPTTINIELSPCEYDFTKLITCLNDEASKRNGKNDNQDCDAFADGLIDFCKQRSKGCTSE